MSDLKLKYNRKQFSKLTGVSRGALIRWEGKGKLVPLKDERNNRSIYTEEHLATIKSWNNRYSDKLKAKSI